MSTRISVFLLAKVSLQDRLKRARGRGSELMYAELRFVIALPAPGDLPTVQPARNIQYAVQSSSQYTEAEK